MDENAAGGITYNHLTGFAQRGNEQATVAIQQTDQMVQQAFPGFTNPRAKKHCDPGAQPQAAAGATIPINIQGDSASFQHPTLGSELLAKKETPKPATSPGAAPAQSCAGWIIYPGGIAKWRNALAVALYKGSVDNTATAMGLNPAGEGDDILYSPAGNELVRELGQDSVLTMSRLAGIMYPDGKGIDNKDSYLVVANNALKDKQKVAESMASLYGSDREELSIKPEQVLDAFETIIDGVSTMEKTLESGPKSTTQDQHEFISKRFLLIKDQKGNERLFVKDEEGGYGISFDSGKSQLLDTIKKYNDLAAKWNEDYGFELGIETVDRQTALDRSEKAIKSNKAVTDVSEEADTIMLLQALGRTKEAAQEFNKLYKQYGENVHKCLGVVKATEDGEFTGTEDTENTSEFIQALQEFTGEEDVASRKAFANFMSRVGARRSALIKQLNPSYVVRTGGRSGAGTEGFKADQIYAWKEPGTGRKQAKPGDFTDSEMSRMKKLYGDQVEQELADGNLYIDYDSLKYSVAENEYAAGGTPHPSKVAAEFTKPRPYHNKMIRAVGANSAEMREVFSELDSAYKQLDGVKNGRSPSQNSEQVNALIDSVLKGGKEQQLASRFFQGKIKDPNIPDGQKKKYRQAAALYMMRGAWDANNAMDTVELLATGKTLRYRRNAMLMKDLKPFIEGETGAKWNKQGFSIGDLTYSTEGDRAQVTKRLANVKKGLGEEKTPEEIFTFFKKLYEALQGIE